MKKNLIAIFIALFAVLAVNAQNMSDMQILEYIQTEQVKGTSQQDIAKKLMSKGVSMERLMLLKDKYRAQNVQPGAMDLMDYSSKKSRLRTNEKDNKGEIPYNKAFRTKQDNFDVLSGEEKISVYEEGVNALYLDSLGLVMEDECSVFGRNMFRRESLTFEPAMNIPIPADYVLGAGDNVFIDIWGSSHEEFEGEISPEGDVVVEGVGPLRLGGKTVEEARNYLKGVLGKVYADSEVGLSVGELRSIQIQVVGEVITPGTFTLNALSTVFNALYSAGGVNNFGTLRDIRVFRNSKQVAAIDVYDFLFNGNQYGNIRLQDNDVISVGTYESIVKVGGKVKRPMAYELKEDETLHQLLRYAGNFAGDAYKENVRVVRKSGREYSLHTVSKDEMDGFAMIDGDSVYIDSVIPRFSNMVEISGAVFYPGQYQLGGKVNSVYELIEVAGGVREDAFLNRAILHHRNSDNTIESEAVNLKGIIEGTAADVQLKNNDALFIPSETEMNGKRTVQINGEVRFPGVYKYAENTSLEDAIVQAGGLLRGASTVKVDVFRQIYDPKALGDIENVMETFSFELKDGLVIDGDSAFTLLPFDEVHVRRSPVYKEQENVSIDGAVNFKGEYVITKQGYRLSDLLKDAGGLSLLAYAEGACLYREFDDEEKSQRNLLLKSSTAELYEEMLRPDRAAKQALLDSLYRSKLNLGNSYPVVINLKDAIENPGGKNDIVLRGGDKLIVPEQKTTIKISGEVGRQVTVNWEKGKKLSYYLDMAGGYGVSARKRDVYIIYMNGRIEKLAKGSKKAIQPGCEIFVPRKVKRYMTTGEIITVSTSITSMVAMMATLVNILVK